MQRKILCLGGFAMLVAVAASAFAFNLRTSNAQTTIPIGVDAYSNHIANEPAGLTYVYKYIVPGGQSLIPGYISTAYSNGKKPVLVLYTNYDSTSPNWTTWDAAMNAVRQDGRDVDIVVEPDLFGYIRNQGACGTTGKQMVDRFLSTAPANAHLGFFISPWSLPYTTPASDAASWKSCWLAAGGDRMPNIYVDVTDRDQEYKGTYPWPASKIQMYEDWFKALSQTTGRKIGVWQIPLGNSQCANGRRSTFVESWLVQSKLLELAPYVDKLLFGPGIEDYDAANTQSWNLPQHVKYECGIFNSRVNSLSNGSTPGPTATRTTAPTASRTVAPTATRTVAPTATRTAAPPATQTVAPTATGTPGATTTPTPASSALRVEAESASLPYGRGQTYRDSAASAGRALLIWSNATATRTVNISSAKTSLTIWAKGDQCNGAPHMVVYIDGVRGLSTSVPSTRWTAYTMAAKLAAGSHTVRVTFDNDYYGSCDRNLRVDAMDFR